MILDPNGPQDVLHEPLRAYAEGIVAAMGMVEDSHEQPGAIGVLRNWSDHKHRPTNHQLHPRVWLYPSMVRIYGRWWIITIDWDPTIDECRVHLKGDLHEDREMINDLIKGPWSSLADAWAIDQIKIANGYPRLISGIGKERASPKMGPKTTEADEQPAKPVFGQSPPPKRRRR